MGSQSVTDFSAARKKRIQTGIGSFDPEAHRAPSQAREAGIAAMGSAAPTSHFVQALTSASVDVAAKTLGALVEALKDRPRTEQAVNEVLASYGVGEKDRQPYTSLVNGLRRKLQEDLNASSMKSEAKPAAEDAMGKTILDVLSSRLAKRKEPVEASRRELVEAIRRTPESRFSTLYLENVITSLLRQTFDAARGRIPRNRIDALVKEVEPALAKKLALELTRLRKK